MINGIAIYRYIYIYIGPVGPLVPVVKNIYGHRYWEVSALKQFSIQSSSPLGLQRSDTSLRGKTDIQGTPVELVADPK